MSLAADDAAASEAKRHYEEGTKAFNLGEYPRAIAEFKTAYNAKPDPLLLYNIAQSYRLAEDASQALFFYKSFLRNMPGATNRKEVEGRIKALEKQAAEQKKEGAAVPPTGWAATPAEAPAPASAAPHTAPPPAPPSAQSPSATTTVETAAPPAHLPAAPAPSSEAHINLTAPATPPPEPSRPFYKKWWFWAGTASAVVIIGVLAAANAKKGPNTPLGTYDPDFTPLPMP